MTYKKLPCPFCGSLDVNFFSGARTRKNDEMLKTVGFNCNSCGNISFWSFSCDEYAKRGITSLRGTVKKFWRRAINRHA